ncbi:MAG: BrnT family toxin [Paracoccaceae bacterium]
MEFSWDESKRREVLEERGVDLLYAALIFESETLTKIDDREDYGEMRFISLGLVDGDPYIVVHTERDDKTRLITAWKGGRKEYERYKNRIP